MHGLHSQFHVAQRGLGTCATRLVTFGNPRRLVTFRSVRRVTSEALVHPKPFDEIVRMAQKTRTKVHNRQQFAPKRACLSNHPQFFVEHSIARHRLSHVAFRQHRRRK